MPLIGLFMQAVCENIERIEFPEDIVEWTLDVVQSAGIDKRERITINAREEVEVPNSKGSANFIVKWEGAKQASTMSVVTITRKTDVKEMKGKKLGEYDATSNEMAPIAIFDCRGMEPTKWHPVGPFTVVAADGGKTFKEVDLSDAEGDGWVEYDDEKDQPVRITELKYEFKVMK